MPIKAEPVGDLPAISRLLQSTGLCQRVDKHYPTHHLWQGTSIGKTLVCSLNLRKRQVAQLEQRCQSAYQQVILRFTRNRGRKTIKSVEEAEQTINKILDKHKVAHLYSWKITLSQDPARRVGI